MADELLLFINNVSIRKSNIGLKGSYVIFADGHMAHSTAVDRIICNQHRSEGGHYFLLPSQ
jgi:hypothetical protein